MRIGIRGMGLIGGSFEKAFRSAGHVVVNLKGAPAGMIGDCELVVVCLPPLLVVPWMKEHADDFSKGTIVVDAAGVKEVVCTEMKDVVAGREWTFVGGHPMAGKERSGYENSDGALFKGASMIFTPFEGTDKEVMDRLRRVFLSIGFARFVVTDPKRHDEMIAYTSQLAHVVSSAYVRDGLAQSHVGFSAGSFQDMTRVATVDPDIWTDLFLANRETLEAALQRLIDRLSEYRDAIRDNDPTRLHDLLAMGRQAKETSR